MYELSLDCVDLVWFTGLVGYSYEGGSITSPSSALPPTSPLLFFNLEHATASEHQILRSITNIRFPSLFHFLLGRAAPTTKSLSISPNLSAFLFLLRRAAQQQSRVSSTAACVEARGLLGRAAQQQSQVSSTAARVEARGSEKHDGAHPRRRAAGRRARGWATRRTHRRAAQRNGGAHRRARPWRRRGGASARQQHR